MDKSFVIKFIGTVRGIVISMSLTDKNNVA
jgi:hypothetical protein